MGEFKNQWLLPILWSVQKDPSVLHMGLRDPNELKFPPSLTLQEKGGLMSVILPHRVLHRGGFLPLCKKPAVEWLLQVSVPCYFSCSEMVKDL